MRSAIILTIFRKEILETLRDRRTLFFSFLLPILLYPALSLSLAKVQETRVAEQQAKLSVVAVWGEASPALQDWLRKTNVMVRLEPARDLPADVLRELATAKPPPELAKKKRGNANATTNADSEPTLEPPPSPVLLAAQRAVLERKADAVLVVWPGFATDLASGNRAALSIYYDSVRDDSRKAQARLHDALIDFRRDEVRRRERERSLPEGFATAIAIREENVSQPKRQVGSLIGSLLPLLLIILSASGGIYVTLDLTAGEKERNTMQTLLCAPLDPVEIIGGKFLAAWTVVLLSALANVASLAATFARIAAPVSDFNIPPITYVLTFFALLPVTFTTTAIFLGVAVFARDLKDGQNFLTPVMLGITLPLAVTSLPGIELTAVTSFVPMVNIALLIKGLFIGEAKTELIFLTLSSASVYALVALVLAARVFHRQHVMLGGTESVREWIQRPTQSGGTPTPTFALATFGIVFVVMFYGSLLLSEKNLAATLLGSQYGFFLLPVLLLALFMRFSPTETFSSAVLPRAPSSAQCSSVCPRGRSPAASSSACCHRPTRWLRPWKKCSSSATPMSRSGPCGCSSPSRRACAKKSFSAASSSPACAVGASGRPSAFRRCSSPSRTPRSIACCRHFFSARSLATSSGAAVPSPAA